MSKFTSEELRQLVNAALDINKRYNTTLNKWGVNTPLRRLHYLSQIGAESRFKLVRESGYYTKISVARNTFKTPFKGKTDAFVQGYLKNSKKMLSYVYANRDGNGNEASGQGYFFRGGGYLQTTHYKNYLALDMATGIQFLKNPDLILQEPNAIIASCFYFKTNGLFKYCDIDDLDGVSDLVNIGSKTKAIGDSNGWEHRKQLYNALKPHFIK